MSDLLTEVLTQRTLRERAHPNTAPVPTDYVTSVGMVTWLASNRSYSGTVFAWEDQSSEGNHFTASGDARPTIVSDWLDGNPGVRFDGVDDIIRRAVFSGLVAGDKPVVIAVATGDSDTPAQSPTIFYMHGVSGNHVMYMENRLIRFASISFLGAPPPGTTSNAQESLSSPGHADDSPHLFMGVSSNASDRAEAWLDNAVKATAGSGAASGIADTVDQISIGAIYTSPNVNWFKGTIGEVIVFANLPTLQELSDLMDGYIQAVWPTVYAGLA